MKKLKKFPSFSQWKQILKVLDKKEKISLFVLCLTAVISFSFLTINFYFSNTEKIPALGGEYAEGVVGQPRFINPVYGETNDIDRSLIELVFSGLMKYDNNGQLVKDLAETYKISEDGKTYEFRLKENVFWHDGKPLTADDIIFTIAVMRNSDYKSSLRAHWIDVETEKVSDRTVKFKLKSPYNSFLENLTVKIIPKHIWENIAPENFTLSPYNLQPIGSGPFQFSDIKQIETGFVKQISLKSNRKYHNNPSFISFLSFKFYEGAEQLVAAANAREIDGFSLAAMDNNQAEAEKLIKRGWSKNGEFAAYSFSSPRYVAVFFNPSANGQKSAIFSDNKVKKALALAVNKKELIEKIKTETKINISVVDSPVLPDFFGYEQPSVVYNVNIEKAKELLDAAGFNNNGSGFREKDISKTPAFQFKNYLKVNSKGTDVSHLQKCLAELDGNFKNMISGETSGVYGKATENAVTEFQKKYLPDSNPTGETGPSTRKKLNELCIASPQNSLPLKFTITVVNQPQMVKVAETLADYWRNIGAIAEINALPSTDIKTAIKNRQYEALIYGEALGALPDFYPFWHSSQKIDPGLNLSAYENKDADQLLKDTRETMDESVKKQKLEKLQNTILNESPALFLYNPSYPYWASQKVKGVEAEKIIDPSKRFSDITNWHIKTRRVWKKN